MFVNVLNFYPLVIILEALFDKCLLWGGGGKYFRIKLIILVIMYDKASRVIKFCLAYLLLK